MAPTRIVSVIVEPRPQQGAAQALDLIALGDIKLELNIDGTKDDAWLAKTISRESGQIKQYCNRVFQAARYREEIWPFQDPFPWQLPGGLMPLQLSARPLATVPSPAGIAAPPAPSLSAGAAGSLPAQSYFVRISYVTANGETAASMETSLAAPASNLLSVAPPPQDPEALAIGWNVYVGAAASGEIRQNAAPLGFDAPWTESTAGIATAGAALPPYVLVVQNFIKYPWPLAEGGGFRVDRKLAQMDRLYQDGYVSRWAALPTLVEYPAGFAEIPDEVQDACIRLVKGRWFARQRDPLVRSQNFPGVYEAQFFFGQGPGSSGDLPPDVREILDRFRTPVVS